LTQAATIKRVYSKEQALERCSAYLREHLLEAELIVTSSATAAMQKIAQEKLQDASGDWQRIVSVAIRLSDRGAEHRQCLAQPHALCDS